MVYQRVIIGLLRSVKVHYGLSEGHYRSISVPSRSSMVSQKVIIGPLRSRKGPLSDYQPRHYRSISNY